MKNIIAFATFISLTSFPLQAQEQESDTVYLTQADINKLYTSSFKSYP